MFGDMFSQMQQQQEELQNKLAATRHEATSGGVTVTVSGTREVINVSIDSSLTGAEGDAEELEDLLVVAVNQALQKAQAKEQEEAQRLMSNMLPGGLGSLGDMLG